MNVLNLIFFLLLPIGSNAADTEKENLNPNQQPSVLNLKPPAKENIAPLSSEPNKDNLPLLPFSSELEEVEFRGELTGKELETLKQPWKNISLVAVFGKVEGSFTRHRSLLVSSNTLFKGVKSLTMRSCGLEDVSIANIGEFFHIRELNLAGNQITDEGVRILSKLPHLEKLNLSMNKITDKGMAIITNSMPNLTYLDVSLNEEVSNVGVDPFLHSTNLTTLIIEFNNITREKAQELKAHINKVVYFPGKKVGSREIMMEW